MSKSTTSTRRAPLAIATLSALLGLAAVAGPTLAQTKTTTAAPPQPSSPLPAGAPSLTPTPVTIAPLSKSQLISRVHAQGVKLTEQNLQAPFTLSAAKLMHDPNNYMRIYQGIVDPKSDYAMFHTLTIGGTTSLVLRAQANTSYVIDCAVAHSDNPNLVLNLRTQVEGTEGRLTATDNHLVMAVRAKATARSVSIHIEDARDFLHGEVRSARNWQMKGCTITPARS
jgi:hypothetical protein